MNRDLQLDVCVENSGSVQVKPKMAGSGECKCLRQVVHGEHLAGLGILQAEKPGFCKMKIIGFDKRLNPDQIQGPIGQKVKRLRLDAPQNSAAAFIPVGMGLRPTMYSSPRSQWLSNPRRLP